MEINGAILDKLVEKGILTKDDLAGGAELNAEQREALADLTIDSSKLKDHATWEKMYDKWEYDSLELDGRFLELDDGTESSGRKPTTAKVKFDPVDMKAVFRASKSYLRRLATKRIPEEQKTEILMAALATVMSKDTEKAVWTANTLGNSMAEKDYLNNGSGHATNRVKDATFAKFNGVIATADASGSLVNSYDAANTSDIQAILHETIKGLDEGYRDEKDDLRFYVPSNIEENLRSHLSKRNTNYGDLILTADGQVKFRGILIVPCPLLQTNPIVTEHITFTATTPVALSYKPIPDSTQFFVNDDDLDSTAVAPYVDGTDFTLDATNGTIVHIPTGSGGNIASTTATVKCTYRTLPQIFLTKVSNFIIAIGVDDMELETQYFANAGVLDMVGRTRVDFKFVKNAWVSRAYNIKDSVASFV